MGSLRLLLPLSLALIAPVWAAEKTKEAKITGSSLPAELRDFLGTPPKGFAQRFANPARKLRSALEARHQKKKSAAAISTLTALSQGSVFADIALYELSLLRRERREFEKSNAHISKLIMEYPTSPYADDVRRLVVENDCDHASTLAKGAKNPARRLKAIEALQGCLFQLPWREWDEREAEVTALYELMKKAKDPLFGSFVTEIIQALPANAKIRARLLREIPDADLKSYSDVARYRNNSRSAPGVKPLYPDVEAFDAGMQAVLKGEWSEASELFKKMAADFPDSDHLDRAKYWIARAEEAQGNEEEAKRRFEEIWAEDPLSYYGLQSALRLKKDLRLYLVPSEAKSPKFEGSLLTRQTLSLWKLRALLEQGLIDYAREEARFLFQHRPGGFTFGQYNPEGALLVARLFQAAGYQMGAFSHAYAALSLDQSLLNTFTLDLIFPQVHAEAFTKAAETTGLHPLLLYSVAKQESAFLPNAVSRSNALGLMQLLLSTARDIIPKVTREELFQPERNAQAGSKYLQKLLQRFGGNIPLALAGYNAGPTRASQWQTRMMEYESMKKEFDVDMFIDTIPFTETRKYVGSILRNYAWYKLLHKDGTITSIQELAFQWQKAPNPPAPTPNGPPEPLSIPRD
jgi:soluble lytic murein transglycosylase-like protein